MGIIWFLRFFYFCGFFFPLGDWLLGITEGQDKLAQLCMEFLEGLGSHLTVYNIYSIYIIGIYMLASFILVQRQ